MTGSQRSNAVLACLAILMCSSPTASAAEIDGPSDWTLGALLGMRYAGPVPALTGFSPAPEVKGGGLRGGDDFSTPYRSEKGCVAFFFPLGKNEHDLRLKWEGAKCDGRPVHGEGTLSISFTFDLPNKGQRQVTVSRGRFENGMLSGTGEKAQFTFDASGTPNESTYAYSGEFADGVLEGVGKRTWTGPASGEPSATVLEGHFSKGSPVGETVYSQLHPYPGVEAETRTMTFNAENRPLLRQPHSTGKIFFAGDARSWALSVSTIKDGWKMGVAMIAGSPEDHGGADGFLGAACEDWIFGADGMRCEQGVLTWQALGSKYPINLWRKPIRIPLPFRRSGSPVRVTEGETVSLRGQRPSETDRLTCNPDLSTCRGEGLLPITSWDYFAGQVVYQDGEVRPTSGLFRRSSAADVVELDKDKKVAFCEDFRTPVQCRRGWLRGRAHSWKGSWAHKALTFDGKQGYEAHPGLRIAMDGDGRYTWDDTSRWVDIRADDDTFVSVGACDSPHEAGQFTCRLIGQTVEFIRRR